MKILLQRQSNLAGILYHMEPTVQNSPVKEVDYALEFTFDEHLKRFIRASNSIFCVINKEMRILNIV